MVWKHWNRSHSKNKKLRGMTDQSVDLEQWNNPGSDVEAVEKQNDNLLRDTFGNFEATPAAQRALSRVSTSGNQGPLEVAIDAPWRYFISNTGHTINFVVMARTTYW